ncbi:hypothetical protein ACFXTH_038170 [Malus domestica]
MESSMLRFRVQRIKAVALRNDALAVKPHRRQDLQLELLLKPDAERLQFLLHDGSYLDPRHWRQPGSKNCSGNQS